MRAQRSMCNPSSRPATNWRRRGGERRLLVLERVPIPLWPRKDLAPSPCSCVSTRVALTGRPLPHPTFPWSTQQGGCAVFTPRTHSLSPPL